MAEEGTAQMPEEVEPDSSEPISMEDARSVLDAKFQTRQSRPDLKTRGVVKVTVQLGRYR